MAREYQQDPLLFDSKTSLHRGWHLLQESCTSSCTSYDLINHWWSLSWQWPNGNIAPPNHGARQKSNCCEKNMSFHFSCESATGCSVVLTWGAQSPSSHIDRWQICCWWPELQSHTKDSKNKECWVMWVSFGVDVANKYQQMEMTSTNIGIFW